MATGQTYINALRVEDNDLNGKLRWEKNYYDGQEATVTYSLLTQPDLRWNQPNDPITNGFKPFTDQQIEVLNAAMSAISSVSGLSFQRVANDTSLHGSTLEIGQYDMKQYSGWASHAHLDTSTGHQTQQGLMVDTTLSMYPDGTPVWYAGFGKAWQTVLHELLHVAGLEHTFEGPTTFDWQVDNTTYSMMSYTHNSHDYNLRTADIITLQSIYGPNRSKDLGNTVHKLGKNKIISDAGGVDTISASTLNDDVRINLNHGSQSRIGKAAWSEDSGLSKGDIHFSNEFWLGHFSFIENATGGKGDDRLTGNELGNTLKGGKGDDVLIGGAGFDKLYGGADEDRFVFGTEQGRDKVYDFKVGDKLDFRTFDFNLNRGGQQDMKFLGNRTNDQKHMKIGTAYFNIKSDTLMVENNGDGKVDYKLAVAGLDEMMKSYFIL